MSEAIEWKVGQEVCVVTHNYSRHPATPKVGKITKVGRKWVTLDGHRPYRFDPITGAIDGHGYSSPGRVWPTEGHYRAHMERLSAWDDLADIVRRKGNAPAHLTTEDIRDILQRITPPTTG